MPRFEPRAAGSEAQITLWCCCAASPFSDKFYNNVSISFECKTLQKLHFSPQRTKCKKERKCWSEIKDEDNRVEIIFEGPVRRNFRRNFYLSNATKVWKHVFDKFVGKNFVGVPLPYRGEVVGSNTDRCCFHLPCSTYVLKQGYNCTDFL